MSLDSYNRKRQFSKTPEPRGARQRTSGGGLVFVVQKHDASHLHYDFRLEIGGVLKSWAIPKGPSLDPGRKSLAVQVEDHPLAYGDFEGTIPQGQYGGGTVMLWDRGTWEPLHDPVEGLKAGKLHFRLNGEKLRGEWSLVRMQGRAGAAGRNWLLIKIKDEFSDARRDVLKDDRSVKTRRSLDQIAGDAGATWQSNGHSSNGKAPKAMKSTSIKRASQGRLPHVTPELATLVERVPGGDEWLHEIKFDGYRILAYCGNGTVRLLTRNGKDWTARFHSIAQALSSLTEAGVVLDGEVVTLDKKGRSDFQALQRYLKDKEQAKLVYYVFDMPVESGQSIADLPLVERKKRLAAVMRKYKLPDSIGYSDHYAGDGERVLAKACDMGLEGIMCKRADDPYVGRRTTSWLKVKCEQRQEFVIVGYTAPQRSRVGFGALLLGYHDDQGRLCYAGRVGTGFDSDLLIDLSKQLIQLNRETSPLDKAPPARERRQARWVRPSLVCEVRFSGWTRDGHLRHPTFIAMRSDKPAAQVVRERAIAIPESAASDEADLHLTHPDKVLFPDRKLSKADIIAYYKFVSRWMLPHVVGRPLALVRCPDGQGGKCFFQRNYTGNLPAAIMPVAVGKAGKAETHVQVTNLLGLLSLVQIGVLEIHTWGCRAEDIEHPDQLIFDLDPGEGVLFKTVAQAAGNLRRRLTEIGLPAFAKTTGRKGVHVVVPIKPTIDWEQARHFCQSFAETFAEGDPSRFVVNMRKDLRGGKIYIDCQRNGRGATAIAPYSTRAHEGATVAMPISWEQLGKLSSATRFTVEQAPRYLKRRRHDPWHDFEAARIDVRPLLAKAKQPRRGVRVANAPPMVR